MSINFGNIIGAAFNVALGVMTGGIGNLVTQLAMQALSGAFNQAIDQSSLSDFAKDFLKNIVNQSLGQPSNTNPYDLLQDFFQQLGGNNMQIASLEQQLQDVQQLLTQLINDTGRENEDQAAGGSGGARGGGRGGNASGAAGWLYALAQALGEKLDELAHEMQEKAKAIDKEDPSTSVEFQVISQQFGIVMNAASTALKQVGESMTSMARKQ